MSCLIELRCANKLQFNDKLWHAVKQASLNSLETRYVTVKRKHARSLIDNATKLSKNFLSSYMAGKKNSQFNLINGPQTKHFALNTEGLKKSLREIMFAQRSTTKVKSKTSKHPWLRLHISWSVRWIFCEETLLLLPTKLWKSVLSIQDPFSPYKDLKNKLRRYNFFFWFHISSSKLNGSILSLLKVVQLRKQPCKW